MGKGKVDVHGIGEPRIGVLDGREAWLCEVDIQIDGARRSVSIFGEDAAQARELAERFAAGVTGDGGPAIGGGSAGT